MLALAGVCWFGCGDGGGPSSDGASAAGTTEMSAAEGSQSEGSSIGDEPSLDSGVAGASVHYYFYDGLGMLQCPGRVPGYSTQAECDDLGRSQTENGPVNQVGLTCDTDSEGCVVGDRLMVTATDRCPSSARFARVTYDGSTVVVRIVDRTPGNGGFDLGLDPYIQLGIYDDFMIGVTGPEDITYECFA